LSEVAGSPARAAQPERESVSSRLPSLRASLWTIFGYGGSQALRLAGSLVLTRLLFRETFGLMALVSTLLQGLTMFSDLGIGPAIVQSRRGQEPHFLDTAWTLQVLRGFVLLLVSVLIAWPAARFYAEPELLLLVPAMGLNVVLSGFGSTSLFTLNRRLEQRRLVLLELSAQIVSLAVSVAWASIQPSVWALVAGTTGSFVVRLVASHTVLSERRARFHWESEAARELLGFGRWIFLSSIVTFCASRLDSLVLAKTLSMGDLGTYSIASNLVRVPLEVMSGVSAAVMFPVLSETFRRDEREFARDLFRLRVFMIVPAVLASAAFALFGDRIIALLYDARYHEAGWMLRTLAAGQMAALVSISSGPALFAIGESFVNMCLEAVRAALLVAGMAFGGHYFGKVGLVVGIASVGPLLYPFWAIALRRRNLWRPGLDLAVMIAAYTLLAGGLFLRR
jgi:O-antigen/teichoic acid export membrane protein